MPEPGDILLVPVPFDDQASPRRRPVLVLSNAQFQRSTPDMLVVAVTSQIVPSPYSLVISNADLSAGKLRRPACVRVDKVYTLAQTTAVKVIGRVNDSVLGSVREILLNLTR